MARYCASAAGWVEEAQKSRDKGACQQAINRYTAAEAQYRAILNSPFPRLDRPNLRLALAGVQTHLGELQEEARDPDAAEATLRSAEEILTQLRQGAARPEYTLLLAEVRHNLGVHFSNKNRWSESRDHFAEGLKLRQGLWVLQSGDRGYRRDLARSYGYLGDAQLMLGEATEAWKSYEQAEELREELARETPDNPNALCLHARDFGNKGFYYDWLGQSEKSIGWHQQRLQYYRDQAAHLGARLPGAYQTERAETAVSIAELELDLSRDHWQDVPDLLSRARDEYVLLLEGESEEQSPPSLRAGLAQVRLAWGKYYHGRRQTAEARTEVAEAQKLLRSLEASRKARPDDFYRLAVTYALQSEWAAAPAERTSAQTRAVDWLGRAVAEGFHHVKRLQRERSFAGLQQSMPKAWTEILASITERKRDR
jgi:tetratricopeptide (TPR) repeat protein